MKTNTFRVLVLDDEPPIIDLYRRILSTAPALVDFDLTCSLRPQEGC